ncbi:hypothetical protein EUX98_g505 [Antrodiella citrinella]|uniref:Tr-type G domain-containing protein n=1 Tax=Antrodiella citrinella TaxID=2447956 RepID=A0A4S4N6L9_9APHY|nr:hypothetical protein EUX98_g505 [Antrodiella citrinella]
MSRHRDIRNMNIADEMQDDYSDGGEDDLSPEDYERLIECADMVRETIGPENSSGITDYDIKDTLYHYNFDVDLSVAWLLEEVERRIAARERRDHKPLPPPPGFDQADVVSPHMDQQGLIRLTPLSPEDPADSFLSPSGWRLSTITEKTERTEDSRDWGPPPETNSVGVRSVSSWTSTTDYGQPIERVEDPNEIPPSPPESALERLSKRESPPSASSTGSRTPTMQYRSLQIEETAELYDAVSPASNHQTPYPPEDSLLLKKSSSRSSQRSAVSAKPKSKLSELASSRSSVSRASRSSRTSATESVSNTSTATYPPLRPSSESMMSFNSDAESSVTGSSLLSLQVRKAIETAMQLEQLESHSDRMPVHDAAATPEVLSPQTAPPAIRAEPSVPTSSRSPAPSVRETPAPPSASLQPPPASNARQPSKLALLAQAKAQGHWMPKTKKSPAPAPGLSLHKSHTEYLTPIANGPTATTAITTTYQSLGSLAKMPRLTPSYPPPVQVTSPTSTEVKKQSKLAMKSRKLQQKPEPEPEPEPAPPPDPIFTAKEREKVEKLAQQKKSAETSSRASSAPGTPKKSAAKLLKSGTSTPLRGGTDIRQLDMSALNLTPEDSAPVDEPPPKITIARENVLEEARKMLEGKDEKKGVSLVVIGHVDAGKSTLIGRLLDFIPNMISGASQADCALLVVDAATGEFEAGFERGGQTREHLILVRSLGVSQVVVAVNKLDQVQWEKDRYEEICSLLRPFLAQSGFHPSKTKFVPVGAMSGINLLNRDGEDAELLRKWYKGPALVDLLDVLVPPTRDILSSLRFPIANVFKGQSSSIAVTGRVCGGIVQVGERLRVLPGDDSALVKLIEHEENTVQWAAAGSNVTLYLTSVDPGHVNIGSVLCPPTDLIQLTTVFTARIIVFDIQIPITAGTSVELFHHSHDVPASISKLLCTIDRASGTIIKTGPRVLAKGASAEVQITLRSTTMAGPTTRAQAIPLEPFSVNKEMGRVLLRRGGETIAAGTYLRRSFNFYMLILCQAL